MQKQHKQRLFGEVRYATQSWDKARLVLVKAEHTERVSSPSRIGGMVTNLKWEAQSLYEELYCGQGQVQNRLKEQQLELFADQASARLWRTNQFRLPRSCGMAMESS